VDQVSEAELPGMIWGGEALKTEIVGAPGSATVIVPVFTQVALSARFVAMRQVYVPAARYVWDILSPVPPSVSPKSQVTEAVSGQAVPMVAVNRAGTPALAVEGATTLQVRVQVVALDTVKGVKERSLAMPVLL
jgi:hypothetical protein